MLLVNEIFETLQGEATHTGTPAVFVRLQGCPVGCGWCDTKHTWEQKSADVVSLDYVLAKHQDGPTHAALEELDLVYLVREKFKARHVVLTGGEPCMFNLNGITELLLAAGYGVQIETSGTFPIQAHDDAFVTVSPKVGMSGGLVVRQDCIDRADEVKFPVGKYADVDKLKALAIPKETPIFLQPLSQSKKATAICIEAATANGWRVSIQTHKYIGVR